MHRRIFFVLLGIVFAVVFALAASVDVAHAQSGHFVGEPICTDIGTQVLCTGKVAELGGTTFEIDVTAPGTASVECINPGGNRAPGQDTAVTAAGSSGPQPTPRNGQSRFVGNEAIATATPVVPNVPTCPNAQWTATVTDVEFGDATLTLSEDGAVSDTITVPVN
jgi:hypothetical protein